MRSKVVMKILKVCIFKGSNAKGSKFLSVAKQTFQSDLNV